MHCTLLLLSSGATAFTLPGATRPRTALWSATLEAAPALRGDGRGVVLAPAEVVALVLARPRAAVEAPALVAVLGFLHLEDPRRDAMDGAPRGVDRVQVFGIVPRRVLRLF